LKIVVKVDVPLFSLSGAFWAEPVCSKDMSSMNEKTIIKRKRYATRYKNYSNIL